MGGIKAALYDAVNARFERVYGSALRRRQLAAAAGRVLEIGAGTGANVPHYPDAVEELVLTEPDRAMLARARRRVAAGREVTFVVAPAEALPFPDDAFDTVVSTIALCTVGSQHDALREIGRVLRPGGQLLFAEHVRAAEPRLARWQDRLERPWGLVAGGCHPNRRTQSALEAAGFRVEITETGYLPMVPRLVKPYIAGRATSP